jgi:hypothetical protein
MLHYAQSELPSSVVTELTLALSRQKFDREPVTIAFATDGFGPLTMNWLAHAHKVGAPAPLVVALDAALAHSLEEAGIPFIRHRYDGSLGDLWLQRTLFFEFLAGAGIDFIHSDVDAVWLRDPRPFCFGDFGLDLIFSQGVNYPAPIWRQWGFVLCCGFFAVRARPAVAAFFSEVRGLVRRVGDDQVVINHLIAERGLVWAADRQTGYDLSNKGKLFTGPSLDLHVGLLPHHLFPRLPIAEPGAMVRHPVGPGDPIEKAAVLRQVGCWDQTAVGAHPAAAKIGGQGGL